MHTSSQDRPARTFARLIEPLRSAWSRSGRISAAISRDFSRGRLVNDGWPIRR